MNQPSLFGEPVKTNKSDDYWTPKWIFDSMNLRFDLDVACPPGGPMFTPCDAYFTPYDNGLEKDWYGRVFMNPPYSNASAWVNKFVDHGNGVAITVVGKSKWMDRLWDVADGFVLLRQEMKFVQGRIPWPIIVTAFGNDNVAAISNLGKVR